MSFRFRYPMDEKRYLLELYKSGILDKKISALSKYYLSLFLHLRALTSYEVFSLLRDTNNRIAKNNVQKNIKLLNKQGFLSHVKGVEKPIHQREFYQVSSFGLFYALANIPEILYNPPFNAKNQVIRRYANDPLLEILFQNILEKHSIRKITSFEVVSSLILYAEQQCQAYNETIFPVLRNIDNNKGLPLEICCWEYVTSNVDDAKSLKKYLIDKLQLDPHIDNFQIKRLSKDKIIIFSSGEMISIVLEIKNKKAKVYRDNEFKYEFDVITTPKPTRSWLIDKVDMNLEEFLASSYSPLSIEHTDFVPTLNDRRLVVNIIGTTLTNYTQEHFADLKLLKNDRKFMKLFERVQKEITVSIQKFNEIS